MSNPVPLPNRSANASPTPPARPASAPPGQPPPPPGLDSQEVLAPAVLQQQQELWRNQQQLASMIQSRRFRDLRFRINNYFEYIRRGLVVEYENLGEQPWDEALADPSKALAPYDRQAPPEDSNDIYKGPLVDDDEAVRAQQAANMRPFPAPAAGFVRPKDDAGDAFITDLRRSIRSRGLDIRSLRHLGAGGTGLATLFEVRSNQGGVRKRFVIKSSRITDDSVLPYEKNIQLSLRRAPHIVRALLWAEDILTTSAETADGVKSFCQEMDDRADMIYLEFMKGGNLSSLIGRALAAGESFPNGILWKVFFCLVRACLAMEYPPRMQMDGNGDWFWGSETGDDGVERVADQDYQKDGYGLVHFDLDPKNVMIGDNDESHPAAPIFKVGDFGSASNPRNPTFADREMVWRVRRAGKRLYRLPEQFHKEWEYVRMLPNDELPVPKVAGNYGPASNVWQIGMILHDLITRNYPPDPPAAFGPMNGPDASLMPDGIAVFRDVDGNAVEPFYTHGRWLRDDETIDIELKGLLLRCLADQPAQRPTLLELNKYVDRANRILGWNDDPDDREWFEHLVYEPPEALDPVDPALDFAGDKLDGSGLSFVSDILRTRPWTPGSRRAPAPQAPQAPRAPQAPQGWPQRPMSRIYNLINAAGASLRAIPGIWSRPTPPPAPPEPQPDVGPVPDDAAWLFSADMDPLSFTPTGQVVMAPEPDTGANTAPDAGERAADRLPPTTPARSPAGGAGAGTSSTPASGSNGAQGPSPFSVLTWTNRTTVESESNAYMSGASSSVSSPVGPPDVFLTAYDPARGRPAMRVEVVISASQSGTMKVCELRPIPVSPPGTDPPLPPEGCQYGRTSAAPAMDGQVVPLGMFTIRIDPVDPGRGEVPNVFYRDLNVGGDAPKAGDDNAMNGNANGTANGITGVGGGGGGPLPPTQDNDQQQGPRAPRVTAVRIPPYGLFERPPPRPEGFHYGRRLYLSPAEVAALAGRGITAPPGRVIIRLVHVDPPEGADGYERPTIFYRIEPGAARAPRAPGGGDPGPNILYATRPASPYSR